MKSAKAPILLLVFSLMFIAVSAGAVSSQTAGGKYDADGDTLIEISNLEQLDAIRHDLNGDGDPDPDGDAAAYTAAFPTDSGEVVCNDCRGFELARSLDFDDPDSYASEVVNSVWTTGEGWEPIAGNFGVYFDATLNGNGHSISGLYINRPETFYASLIGNIGTSGLVEEIGVIDVDIHALAGGGLASGNEGTIDSGYSTGKLTARLDAGGLVSRNRNGGNISNSHSTVHVSGGRSAGGLAGDNVSGSTITSSYATGSVSGTSAVGGLVGVQAGATVSYSYATGNVTYSGLEAESRYGFGGLVGENWGTIIGSYATGSVRGIDGVGGLAGWNYGGRNGDAHIIASYAAGSVSGAIDVGGLAGNMVSQEGGTARISASYAVGIVSGSENVGGLVGIVRRGDGREDLPGGIILSSYWDTETSGTTTGIAEGGTTGFEGKTTAELQQPTDYTGIYSDWNADLDNVDSDDNASTGRDDFWDFGTGSQYPALKADFDGDGTAAWAEFGDQPRVPRAPVDPCAETIAADGTYDGQWTSDCQSMHQERPGSYARFYAFTLASESEVTITLERTTGSANTYLYLRSGETRTGPALYEDDDHDGIHNSQIVAMLAAGTHTVEATTYNAAETGSFTLTVGGLGAATPTTVDRGPEPAVSVSRATGSENATLRPGSPISLTAAFSRPVSGFTVDDITVGNGTVGNFAGSGAVYTFDVTPNDIGEVTVDIAAGAAEDTDGNGNTASPQFSLGITYDDNGDGAISKPEAIAAIRDYFSGGITKTQAIAVIVLYFSAPTEPGPGPGTPEGDRAALIALYNATGGPNWEGNNNWLSDVPISEWSGVTTGDNGRVTGLDLGGNQLSGEIPPELGNLANLKLLYLNANQLSGEIPPELGNLANLELLYLAENQLSGEIPPELDNLANLKWLRLEGNQLSGGIPPELDNLANLTFLDLGRNQLSGEIPPELGNLANLQGLYLAGNQLSGEIPPELGNLANLKSLVLSRNQLSGEIPPELGDLANLDRLNLSWNQLTGEIPPELDNLANLKWLRLEGNQLSGEIPPELGNLANLEGLHLEGNQLSGEIPPELGNLANLIELFLYGNQLTGEIPPELGNLANLKWLYLYGNQLSGGIPPELGNLANLQELFLDGNELSGKIPPELGNLANLEGLRLDGNQLSGCVPSSLSGRLNMDFSNLGGLPFCP